MLFEWDEVKSRRNLLKHGIGFETAKLVFDDPYSFSVRDRFVEGEERWQTLGMIGGEVVMVAHTHRDEGEDLVTRIISARKATPTERKAYAEAYEASS